MEYVVLKDIISAINLQKMYAFSLLIADLHPKYSISIMTYLL